MNANCGLTTIAGCAPDFTPCLFARASKSCPAWSEFAIGFSLQTCLPACIAWRLSRSCSCMSVRLTIRSNGAPASSLSMCGYWLGILNFSAWALARSGMMSQALTSSTCGHFDRCGRYMCETLPQPITPTRMRFASLLRPRRRLSGEKRGACHATHHEAPAIDWRLVHVEPLVEVTAPSWSSRSTSSTACCAASNPSHRLAAFRERSQRLHRAGFPTPGIMRGGILFFCSPGEVPPAA